MPECMCDIAVATIYGSVAIFHSNFPFIDRRNLSESHFPLIAQSPYIPLLGFRLNFLLASRHHPDSPTSERTKGASQERNRESNSPNSTALQTPLLSRSVSPASPVSAANWPCRISIPHFVWTFFQDGKFFFPLLSSERYCIGMGHKRPGTRRPERLLFICKCIIKSTTREIRIVSSCLSARRKKNRNRIFFRFIWSVDADSVTTSFDRLPCDSERNMCATTRDDFITSSL